MKDFRFREKEIVMHHQFRYTLLFIVLALFGFTSLGYSQDFIEQPNGKPSFLDVGFSTFLVNSRRTCNPSCPCFFGISDVSEAGDVR